MKLREGRHDEKQPEAPAPGPSGLDDLRASAERLLAAGNDAIDRALSSNSDEFLRANEQSGGE